MILFSDSRVNLGSVSPVCSTGYSSAAYAMLSSMTTPAQSTEKTEEDDSVLLSSGRILPGVRARLLTWLNSIHPDDSKLFAASLGMNIKRLWNLCYLDHVPTLRQAYLIEILTEGRCKVYDWADCTDVQEASKDVIAQTTKDIRTSYTYTQKAWPPFYDDDLSKKLRWELARRLTRPEDNILSLIIKMGKSGIRQAERAKALENTPLSPPVVGPEATDEEIEKELWRYRRQVDTRTAYKLGTRRGFDTE